MNEGQYILNSAGEVQAEPDLLKWGQWLQTAHRTVAMTELPNDVRVSTVFLGLDHNFHGDGPPLLWETMIFGGPNDTYMRRYSSVEAAREGHDETVKIAEGDAS